MNEISRRTFIAGLTAATGCAMMPDRLWSAEETWKPLPGDEAFLDELQRQACLFFWEQASPITGQVLDRARNDGNGKRDPRRMASIAATGFALSSMCIADKRSFLPHAQIVERVRTTLDWHLNKLPNVRGFYYHFNDIETGKRVGQCELSSIDTALLLCGVLTAAGYFKDEKITSLAHQLYERVEWPWMLNDGPTFSMGWNPETGFLKARWGKYCELMMLYLLAIGSPTHPVAPEYWTHFTRPKIKFAEYEFIGGNDPLFTHQYSQAYFDFRGKRDTFTDYFANSVTATKAHKAFCLSHPEWFNDNYWGVSASDYIGGYTAWGGPPAQGPLDGTVVPCAAGGSLAFVPKDCVAVLRAMRKQWGEKAWGRYGFVDAFHPAANWYDIDVLGIDQGITVVMAENLRTGAIWKSFMSNSACAGAMNKVGFKKS